MLTKAKTVQFLLASFLFLFIYTSAVEAAEVKRVSTKDTKYIAQNTEQQVIKEIKGIKAEHDHTYRIAEDSDGLFTRMRVKPDRKSKRISQVRQGDRVAVLDTSVSDWYRVRIVESTDETVLTDEGWIERWLVDDANAPSAPTPMPTSSLTPTPTVAVAQSSDDSEKLFNMINDYRKENSLPAYEKSDRLCKIANERAPAIAGELARGAIHEGFYNGNYGYPNVIENAVAYGNIDQNFYWWKKSSVHRRNMLSSTYKYSCVGCSNGNCVQIFSATQ
jgi:hypothetical protein